MSWLRLTLANLTLTPLGTAVNVMLMGLGTASIVLLLLAGTQLSNVMARDAENVDLVLGAPGSPVQLILAAVYHADSPPGNILLHDAQRWIGDPRIAKGVPLSLGDSFRGFRIVGTQPNILELYGGRIATGAIWQEPMEAVVGSAVATALNLGTGSSFAGVHGLAEGGHDHDGQRYRVVGELAPTGTVLDRLILTSLESVWDLHESERHDGDHHLEKHDDEDHHQDHHDEDQHNEDHHHDPHHDEDHHEEGHHLEDHDEQDQHDVAQEQADREVTAVLVQYRSPLAATTLPRQINAEGALQAAAPAVEISRLLRLVGLGLDGLRAFAWILIVTAALSIFAALYSSLRARRGELAVLRCLGATRMDLLRFLVLEGLVLSALGILIGFIVGHTAMSVLANWIEADSGVAVSGWIWVAEEGPLLLGLLMVGVLGAVIPAIQAYRTDVARTLAEG